MKSKLNILHVGFIDGRSHSGVDIVVPKYLQYQSKHANVALLNISPYIQANQNQGYKIFQIKNGLQNVPAPFNYPDLVVFHEVYRTKFTKIAKYLQQNNIPYTITPHVSLTDTAQNHKKIKKIIGNTMVFDKFVKNAKVIHFLSESEMQQSSKYNHLPYFIRNNGIEITGRSKKIFNKDKLRLIYVGRLDTQIKGIDRIIKAAIIIHRQMIEQDIHISIYGADQDGNRVKLQKMIDKNELSAVVTIEDAIYGNAKVKKIISNDCFIQLSRTEGQPLALMEAMDIGMPCIVTNGTTFLDIVKSNNSGIPVSDNPDLIAETILNIRAGDYDLEKISSNASKYATSNFAWTKLGSEMISDYSQTLYGSAE